MTSDSSAPQVSVLLPTRNPGPAIMSVLDAVFAQETDLNYEVLVVDSGSQPHDLTHIKSFPVQLTSIPPSSFGHGRTRNLLAQRARGDALLFLSQDAEPASPRWMDTLVAPLRDSSVAGAYARQIPRANADPLIRFFLKELYSAQPSRRGLQP